MPIEILMPALSPTMESGTLAKWHIKKGDAVKIGDIIAEIETDKAMMEVEAVEDGTISDLLVENGAVDIPVHQPIAILVGDDEDSQTSPPTTTTQAAAPKPTPSDPPPQSSTPNPPASPNPPAAAPKPPAPAPADPPISGQAIPQRQALRDAMAEEMRRDPDIFILGEEVGEYQGAYKVTQGLLDEFGPQRVIDTPIAEHGFTGLAVGAAFAGLKPIVEFMTFNFAMQAIDQIVNSAAKTLYMSGGLVSCPIVFRGPNGPAARVAAQHSQDYASWYMHVPGLKVVAPSTAADAKGLLKAAIRDPNPVIFLESELLYGNQSPVPDGEFVLPIGKARIVRSGRDATLVSFGNGMTYASQAVEILAEAGIDVELIDLRTLRPLDVPTLIASLAKTNRMVTVEEGWPQCGVGAEIAATMMQEAFDDLDAPILRVSGKDIPMPYAANLEKLALPSVDDIVAAIRAVTYR